MDKKTIRKQLISERKQLNEQEVNEKSRLINKRIVDHFPLDEATIIALYFPFNKEVDVRPLIQQLLDQNKKVALPKVLSKTTMEFFMIDCLTDLKQSAFGVYEPTSNNQVAKHRIDYMFIPGVAFNEQGYRLGYGAGFYDRFLAEHSFTTIGVVYDFQIQSTFPIDSHDIPLNYIISESRLLQPHNEDY